MKKIGQDLGFLLVITLASTFLVWLPFVLGLGQGMLTIFANYDGPNYIVIAKTLYDKAQIAKTFSLPTPLEYYPAHFPAYPLLVKLFGLLLPGTWSMLMVTLSTSFLAVFFFYLFVHKFGLTTNPLWLAIIFLFLPARWLVVRSVGSPEPLFIAMVLASFYFFKSAFDTKENNLFSPHKSMTFDFFLAGFFGALAQATKTPGILLFVAYGLWLMVKMLREKKIIRQAWPLLLIPLPIPLIFSFYQVQAGDFLAYFHSGDNFHLFFPPFQAFVTGQNWLGDFWLEDIVWQYLIGVLAVIFLFQRKLYDLATFVTIFFVATCFVAHRDLARYSLPLVPFALIAFAPFLEKKEFKIAFFFILIPVYLYAINFLLHNTAPVADWTPYL